MDWIAEGLSSLGFFLEPCRHGREPAGGGDRAVLPALREAQCAGRRAETTHAARPGAAHGGGAAAARSRAPRARASTASCSGSSSRRRSEVLQTIEAARCRSAASKPEDREALTTMRRALPHAEGQRPHGRPDGPGRGRLGNRAGDERLARAEAPGRRRRCSSCSSTAARRVRRSGSRSCAAAARRGPVDAQPERRARRRAPKAAAASPTTVTVRHACTVPRGARTTSTPRKPPSTSRCSRRSAPSGAARAGATLSQDFMRAAHTLASSSRTAGFAGSPTSPARSSSGPRVRRGRRPSRRDADRCRRAIAGLRRCMVDADRQGARRRRSSRIAARPALRALIGAPARPRGTRRIGRRPAAPAAPAARRAREARACATTSTSSCCRSSSRKRRSWCRRSARDLRDWKANPVDEKVSQSLRRALHTLKGSARMAGAIRLGELCHLMESRIEAALEAGGAFPAELFEELEERMDRLSLDVERMRRRPAPAAAAPQRCRRRTRRRRTQVLPQAARRAAAAQRGGDAARQRRHARPPDQRVGRGRASRARASRPSCARSSSRSPTSRESIARLRGQLREVEIQADSQMQSRLSVMDEKQGRVRPARVRPLHAPAGAHPPDGREPERRDLDPAGAAARTSATPTPRCCSRRASAATCSRS